MSEHDIPSLPPDIDALLGAERTSVAPPAGARARVHARLEATLGLAVAATAAGSAAHAAAQATVAKAVPAKLAVSFISIKGALVVTAAVGVVGVGAVGAGAYLNGRHVASPAPASRAIERPARMVEAKPVVTETEIDTETVTETAPKVVTAVGTRARVRDVPRTVEPIQEPAAAEVSTPRRVVETPSITPPPPPAVLEAERALLEEARACFGRRDFAGALERLSDHGRRFADGQLAEEREGLWIRTLAARGEETAARARAEQFRERFPRSIFLPAIDRALAIP